MAVNTNCLEGMRCPNCGQNECFMVDAIWHGQMHIYEDGTDERSGGNTEWKDESPASCVECPWTGTAYDLYWMTRLPPKIKEILVTLLEYVAGTKETGVAEAALDWMDLSEDALSKMIGMAEDILTESDRFASVNR